MAMKLVLVALYLAAMAAAVLCEANAQKPAIFIFGDSTADVGTNNFLPGSKARADFPFNGIDFPYKRPTGRFSNGYNSADLLASLFGYRRSPPAFLSLKTASAVKRKSFRGVNFASGGSGLLELTGQTMVSNGSLQSKLKNVIPQAEQIKQFYRVYRNLTARMGPLGAELFVSESLFFFSTGSNDIFEYYKSGSTIPKEQFMCSLSDAYEKYLRALLKLGARKFGIISVASIGCCPSQRVLNATEGCLEGLNELAREFHVKMGALLHKLSYEYKYMKYSLGNAYEMTINVIENPSQFGFKDVTKACCGGGKLNAEKSCTPEANLCPKRNEYLFWDLFHPTQTASELAAVTLFNGGQRFVSPINFSQLAAA